MSLPTEHVLSSPEPQVKAEDIALVKTRLEYVLGKVAEAKKRCTKHVDNQVLVAVGKTKPVELIVEAYKHGQRHFGENYVNELQLKSNHSLIEQFCPDIKWHFIGHVQSNKVKKLIGCPNLYMVHTIDSDKLADVFNKAWDITLTSNPLNIMIQVNTSQETSKSGVQIEEAEKLLDHIIKECPHLNVKGLMTIGSFNHDLTLGPNTDYLSLINLRDCLETKFEIHLELSMGMSNDFEHAIDLGSNYIRVGEKIFGSRQTAAASSIN